MLCSGGRLVLIDFGSAAVMGDKERKGYDWHKSPCDPRYAPPEQFIDEDEWSKYDLYCVGLILVRVLFPPLWSGDNFDEFADSYHDAEYDLDKWLRRIIMSDSAFERKTFTVSEEISTVIKDRLDAKYLDLAEESCLVQFGGSRLNMCSMKPGLVVLNKKGLGICWNTLR